VAEESADEVLTIQSVRDYVLGHLGASQVDIELLSGDIDRAATQTLRVFNRYCPRFSWSALPFAVSRRRYEIVHPGLLGVTDVSFLTRDDNNEFSDLFDPLAPTATGGLGGGSMYSDYAMILNYREMASQVASTEAEWRGDWERRDVGGSVKRVYALYVSATSAVRRASYEYTWHIKFADGEDGGLTWVPAPDHDWFLRHTYNEVLPPLVRALDKFGGVMTPEGGNDPTDSGTLQSKYESDKATLLEEIKLRSPPPLPSLG